MRSSDLHHGPRPPFVRLHEALARIFNTTHRPNSDRVKPTTNPCSRPLTAPSTPLTLLRRIQPLLIHGPERPPLAQLASKMLINQSHAVASVACCIASFLSFKLTKSDSMAGVIKPHLHSSKLLHLLHWVWYTQQRRASTYSSVSADLLSLFFDVNLSYFGVHFHI